jgi:hypothetical protein
MTRSSPTGTLTILGAGALMVPCCTGPVLLASGVLSGLGAALASAWLIGIGAAIALAAAVYLASRIARGSRGADGCCPPPEATSAPTERESR